MKEQIIDFIIQAICEMGYPISLDRDSNFVNDAGLDSLDVVDLCAVIEENYDIHITEEEYPIFKESISEVADLILSKL